MFSSQIFLSLELEEAEKVGSRIKVKSSFLKKIVGFVIKEWWIFIHGAPKISRIEK